MADKQIHELAAITRDPISTDVLAIDTGTLTFKVPYSRISTPIAQAALTGVVAAEYTTSGTYAVGDYCTKDGTLYRCKTAIPTGEAWTSSHWKAIDIGTGLKDDYRWGTYNFAPLILGKTRYIDYDTTGSGTITIPTGTTYVMYRANGTAEYKVINSSEPITVQNVNSTALTTSSAKLILDISNWSFSVVGYKTALTSTQMLVAGVRTPNTLPYQIALYTPLPWSINGVPYNLKETVTAKTYESSPWYYRLFSRISFTANPDAAVTSTASTTQLGTAVLQHAASGIHVVADSPYFCDVIFCSSGDICSSTTGWVNQAFIPAGSYYHIAVRKYNSPTITLDDITNVHIIDTGYNYLDQKFKYCFAPIMLGFGRYMDFNTANGTITIPKDAVYFGFGARSNSRLEYYALNGSADIVITGVDYESIGTSAFKLVLDTSNWTFSVLHYQTSLTTTQQLVALVRGTNPAGYNVVPSITSPIPWSINGIPYGIETFADYSGANIVSVNHRGYSTSYPENTLVAFRASKEHAFSDVETDVQFTSDGIPVLLHDPTINRTARLPDGSQLSSTVYVKDVTYNQLLEYDFGIWRGSKFAGTKIPTFEQFLKFCRGVGLHPHIEIKTETVFTQAQIESLVDMVKACGMEGKVNWLSLNYPATEYRAATYLGYIHAYDPKATIELVMDTINTDQIAYAQALKGSENEVIISAKYDNSRFEERLPLVRTAGFPLYVWTIDNTDAIAQINPYVTGFLSNHQNAAEILYAAYIS